jgi:hypothetical protein
MALINPLTVIKIIFLSDFERNCYFKFTKKWYYNAFDRNRDELSTPEVVALRAVDRQQLSKKLNF